MNQLLNKVAVITGGNSGIGFATAQVFLTNGARVLITGRKEAAVNQAVAALGSGAAGFVADQGKLSDADALAAHVKAEYGQVDVLFINAGIAQMVPFPDASEQHFDDVMNINFKGAFFTAQKLLPLLKDGGTIVFLSSISAISGMVGNAVYSASKAALNSLARTLTRELAPRNIRVNVVNPGPIATPIFEKIGLPAEQLEEAKGRLGQAIPLQRIGEAVEVARLVAFLASDDAKFISGAEVNIDGGIMVHPVATL
ncbi:SDR family oxidoreductase [Chitinophaga japonensis]|uniref:NAD(P)-dependent dehydrogenase (Short-subunit alcohol dehydrogenase family) n=1 Tax=Chitinophaga japonensis TaxID=104662 RepID=A0A562STZ7_CHIJA|nr:SDR family oxidoreductase [Chitinophaga japonensis]TWI84180.1 NAD(P)-dependent dehydrogenase (short-subunit alcohol dehydrogenase family) [Chitinophaga japonensis]